MVQVHVTPQITPSPAITCPAGSSGRCGVSAEGTGRRSGFAKLPYTCGRRKTRLVGPFRCHRGGGFLAVKKLIVLAALGLGAFAVWRKVQSDRAELDLWTEATAADDD